MSNPHKAPSARDRRYPPKPSGRRTLVELLALSAFGAAVMHLARWVASPGPGPIWWDGPVGALAVLVVGVLVTWWRRRRAGHAAMSTPDSWQSRQDDQDRGRQ